MTDTKIIWHKIIDSTNLEAHRQKEQFSDFTIFAAEFQTAGRGQRGNVWESAACQNLTFTILLKPANVHPSNQFVISEVVALGVASYLEEKGLKPKIKWPNDIYVDNLKICGILIEHSVQRDRLSESIAGIGLNVNQLEFNSDAPNPTSLILELRRRVNKDQGDFELDKELVTLSEHLKKYYAMIGVDENKLEQEYLSRLYQKDQVATYVDMTKDEEFQGIILGVTKNACLIIRDTDGQDRQFAFKELKYLIPQ